MFHLVPYKRIRKTHVIQEYVVFYKNWVGCGQSSVTATSAYLGVSDNSALELARSINV